MTVHDLQQAAVIWLFVWGTPLLVSLLSTWVIRLRVNDRARILLWLVYVGWSAGWVWFWYAMNVRTRPWPKSLEEHLFVYGLWASSILGIMLLIAAEWAVRKEFRRAGFDVANPEPPLAR